MSPDASPAEGLCTPPSVVNAPPDAILCRMETPAAPAEPPRHGVLLVSAITLCMIALSGSCAIGSGLALFFGDDAQRSGDPIHAMAIVRDGDELAEIQQAGMIVVDDQGIGLVVGELVLDRDAEVAQIDSGLVVHVDGQPRGSISSDGAVDFDDAPRWRVARDGTITKAGEDSAWAKAVGYQATKGDRRALGAYLLFFADE